MRSRLFHAVIATGIALGAVAIACDDKTTEPVADGGTEPDAQPPTPPEAVDASDAAVPDDAGEDAGPGDAGPDVHAEADAAEHGDADAGDDGGWLPTK